MKKPLQVFLSYSHKNYEVADSIGTAFQNIGIKFNRDIRDVGYKINLDTIREHIRDGGLFLMIISDEFLKSTYCMYEAIEYLKEEDIQDRILFIVLDNAQINVEGRAGYVKYWNEKFHALNEEFKKLSPERSVNLIKELQIVHNVYSFVGEFLHIIINRKFVTLSELKETNYEILNFINNDLEDELLRIMGMKDISDRVIELNKFIKNRIKPK